MGQQEPRYRWHVLAVMIVCLLVIVLDSTVLNVALRTLAEPRAGLGASQSQLEWAVNSYTLVFAGLLLTAGVIGDKLGRKRVLAAGLAWFATASLLCAYARSPDQLIAARAAMGLGGAVIMPQTLSIITNVFEPAERPRAIAIWGAAVGLAVAIGPVTGGLLLSRFWWGSVFLINVPIVTVGLAGVIRFVPESRNPRPGKLDVSGVLLSIAGLVSLSYGVIQGGGTGHWASLGALAPLTAGLILLALFTWHESRIKNPALNVRLFSDPRLCCAVAALVLAFFSLSGVLFVTSFYLQNVRNYSPLRAGLLMLPFAAGQLIFAPRSAIMVAKFGAKNVLTAGLLLVAAAYSGYELMGAATPVWVLGMIFFVLGAGLVHILPPANECLMAALPREQAGSGSGINSTARQIAEALGVAVLSSILTAGYRARMSPHLEFLSPAVRTSATESIGATMAVAQHLGAAGAQLATPARTAFISAMHITLAVAVAVAVFGAVVVRAWMPAAPRPAAGIRNRGGRARGKDKRVLARRSRPLSRTDPGSAQLRHHDHRHRGRREIRLGRGAAADVKGPWILSTHPARLIVCPA
jgi:EmrB/QacA subfamily drug resistance transporter